MNPDREQFRSSLALLCRPTTASLTWFAVCVNCRGRDNTAPPLINPTPQKSKHLVDIHRDRVSRLGNVPHYRSLQHEESEWPCCKDLLKPIALVVQQCAHSDRRENTTSNTNTANVAARGANPHVREKLPTATLSIGAALVLFVEHAGRQTDGPFVDGVRLVDVDQRDAGLRVGDGG